MKPQFSLLTENESSNFARFIIEPLPQGFGHTLGNSLRRVLYSSIPGSAITSVSISGVNHQFTTLPGVQEDMVQIILNLKQVRLSYSGAEPIQISLSSKGHTQVTAADFELPASIVIANPDLVLAHLTDKSAKLEITATVESGLGYSPAEDRVLTTIGTVPLDASFTPVTRVNFSVEATRVGRVTNYDKLIMDVTTDGTISPKDALTAASQTLVDYFSSIVSPVTPTASATGASTHSRPAGPSIAIEELDLPTRISNALQKAGFDTVAQLLSTPRPELAKIKNLGSKSVKIIDLALKDRGFELQA